MLALPINYQSMATLSASHHGMLLIGGIWWLVASILALTYPSSTSLWSKTPFKTPFWLIDLNSIFWSILLLRAVNYEVDSTHGAKLVLLVCLIVWAADTGAYFSGKRFGKHKMAPLLARIKL